MFLGIDVLSFVRDILIDGERRLIVGYNSLNSLSILLIVFEFFLFCIALVVIISKPISVYYQLVFSFSKNTWQLLKFSLHDHRA